MGIQPKIKSGFLFETCPKCGNRGGEDIFIRTKSVFYPSGYLPLCTKCLHEVLEEHGYDWEWVDKLCQYADVPFVPKEFERIKDLNPTRPFKIYAETFLTKEYEDLGWGEYYQEFKKLKESGDIEDELPEIKEAKYRELREKWGFNYDEEELRYLESLYNGLLLTQNVSGALQNDQALKICKISLNLDSRIRAGEDFDKLMSSYDKMIKVSEFTPKNVKNASDFESVGEVLRWLEKKGFKAKYFTNVSKDIVDETLKNIQAYNRRLYVNESGIGEEISRRIEALNSTAINDNDVYNIKQEYDVDEFENEAFEELFKEDNKFKADV